jgi:dipeptidyl aminopeptidase/acylaminoacyl peptidase
MVRNVPDATTPFHDLRDYVGIPRVTALRLSPDGNWLAASVQTLSKDRKKYVTSIWRIDVNGDVRGDVHGDIQGGVPRRLTRSAEGEGSPRFLPDGSLLFTSKRPVPDKGPAPERDGENGNAGNHDEGPALWLLPAGGGEARIVASLPGGITGLETADCTPGIVVLSPALGDDDERLRKERKDAGVTAVLHETVPVRYWDHDLGPAELRLFAVRPPKAPAADNAGTGAEDPRYETLDLTPDGGRALFEPSVALSPDGTLAAATWWRWRNGVLAHRELALIDLATGKRTVLLSDPDLDYGNPAFSPDGKQIACVRSSHLTPEEPPDHKLVLISTDGSGAARDLTGDLDRWPASPAWDPSGRCVYFTADDGGRHPVFRVEVASGESSGQIGKVTTDHGYYSDLNPSPDGAVLFALRSAVDAPAAPVRIDVATGEVTPLESPGAPAGPIALPGRLTEIATTADDGHPLRAWLVLPEGAAQDNKAPLVLLVHGGPMSSWNSWSWRWNPWLIAAKGYAVLLPDPALSTGYGNDFIRRGYHQWGQRPFDDAMAVTDAAVARDDIDESKTAMMGGSYGGYMANWIAGHTDRFKAIVSHASLWALDQMMATTDAVHFFYPQFGDPLVAPEMYVENSPHLHVAKISTPMLVIHGNRDYRVPLSESLRLWWDLNRHQVPAKFLYFPDENHWILSPGNARIWYETVFAFLAEHVLGEPWQRPSLL